MFKKTLSASMVLLASALSFDAAATCAVGDYCIDFEDSSFVAQDEAPGSTGLTGSMWATVMDDEYTGSDAFGGNGGVSVQFWTSTLDNGNADGTPDTFPTFTGAPNYNELNGGTGNESAPYLVLLDTNEDTAQDNDLEVGPSYQGGNIAIIHEEADTNRDCVDTDGNNVSDYCENADDRYNSSAPDQAPHGGFVFVHFSEPVHVHSIDLVDIETNEWQLGSFGFYDDASNLLSNGMVTMDYAGMGNGTFGTQTFDNSLQNLSITTLVVRMQGSGGFDNIAFSKVTQVSEPSTLAVFAIGLLGLARLRKAKR